MTDQAISDRSKAAARRFAIVLGAPPLAWQVVFFVVPLGFLIAMTFWSVRNFRLQPDFTVANWVTIFKADFFAKAFIHTFTLSLLAAALCSLIAFPAAYAIVFRAKAATRRLLIFTLIVPFFTSFPVRIYSMQVFFSPPGIINRLIEPFGWGPVHVLNTSTGTVIGFLTLTMPLVVLLQTLALGGVDKILIEAAHNLRCGRVRTILTVILPSARVGLVLAAAFAFVLCFGDYISPQLLGGSRPPTLSILIADQVKSGNNWPRASVVAVSMIVTLMVVLGVLMRIAYGGKEGVLKAPGLRERMRAVMLYGWTALVFLFVLAPIVSTVVFSFNIDRFPSLPWGGFTLAWYTAVLTDDSVRRSLGNSIIVAAAAAAIATVLGFAAAYVDYRFRFFGKRAYVALASLPPTVPVVILGVAMLTFEGRVGLSGTLAGVVAGHVVLCSPFAMALVRMRLSDLDRDLEPAAWNLGANAWTSLREIVIPFALPAILASLFITAAVSFDEYMIAWFVSGLNETLPVRLLAMLQGQVSPRINAVGSLVFAVSAILVVLAQILTRRKI